MIKRFAIGLVAGLSLAACGGSDAPSIEDAETPPAETETSSASSPGYGPPAEEYAQSGDVITAKVGEEFSFKLDLPDSVSTGISWHIVDGEYEPVVSYDKTWRAQEGTKRYAEIVLKAEQAGETTITYHVLEMGQRYSDEERTITFRVTN